MMGWGGGLLSLGSPPTRSALLSQGRGGLPPAWRLPCMLASRFLHSPWLSVGCHLFWSPLEDDPDMCRTLATVLTPCLQARRWAFQRCFPPLLAVGYATSGLPRVCSFLLCRLLLCWNVLAAWASSGTVLASLTVVCCLSGVRVACGPSPTGTWEDLQGICWTVHNTRQQLDTLSQSARSVSLP